MKCNQNKKLALIGAGVSNLSFLFSLPKISSLEVQLFEKERKISGRAATRNSNEYIYDHGANYINLKNERIRTLITKKLDSKDLIHIDKWIYPFDKFNKINFEKTKETIDHNSNQHKYNYKNGIKNISNLLLDSSQVDHKIKFKTQITKISKIESSTKWEIFTQENVSAGIYDYLVFGIPIPQLVQVLNNSKVSEISFENSNFSEIIKSLNEIEYKSIYSAVVGFKSKPDFNFYALINNDRENDISWVSIENEKFGRIGKEREDSLLMIVQMSDTFSKNLIENKISSKDADKIVIEKLIKLLPQLDGIEITFTDSKLWKYALPKNRLNEKTRENLAEKNIFIIGDSLCGKGRIDGAISTGLELGDYFSLNKLI